MPFQSRAVDVARANLFEVPSEAEEAEEAPADAELPKPPAAEPVRAPKRNQGTQGIAEVVEPEPDCRFAYRCYDSTKQLVSAEVVVAQFRKDERHGARRRWCTAAANRLVAELRARPQAEEKAEQSVAEDARRGRESV